VSRSMPIPSPAVGGRPFLIHRIVQLAEGIPQLEASDIKLEAFHPIGFVGLYLGER